MKTFYNDTHKKPNIDTTGTPYPTNVNLHEKHIKQKQILETAMNTWELNWDEKERTNVRKRLPLPAGYTINN